MSDTAVTIVVTGVVQITVLVCGFLTLWVKLKYGVQKSAENAATAATMAVTKADAHAEKLEKKLDDNTATTNTLDQKADIIVDQTNGSLTKVWMLVEAISERVSKLEDYNHDSTHRLAQSLQAIQTNVAVLLATQRPGQTITTDLGDVK